MRFDKSKNLIEGILSCVGSTNILFIWSVPFISAFAEEVLIPFPKSVPKTIKKDLSSDLDISKSIIQSVKGVYCSIIFPFAWIWKILKGFESLVLFNFPAT